MKLVVEITERTAAVKAALRCLSLVAPRVEVRRANGAWTGDTLRIEPASLVQPALALAAPGFASVLSDDPPLGLTPAIWCYGSDSGAWREASMPLTSWPWWGTPSRERPWLLAQGEAPAVSELPDAQVHTLGFGIARDRVHWYTSPGLVRALLDRVECVAAPRGPLAWDALRAGTPWLDTNPEWTAALAELDRVLLAHVVPAPLVSKRGFWASLVRALESGTAPDTEAWVREARALAAPPMLARIGKKFRKLQRDPAAFARDSRLASLRALEGRIARRQGAAVVRGQSRPVVRGRAA